jgi:hypothetical protein
MNLDCVLDYRVEWDGMPLPSSLPPSLPQPSTDDKGKAKEKISLYDKTLNLDSHPITFSPLPALPLPPILQAPYTLPPLFPFSRTTAYIFFSPSPSSPLPTSVFLRGTTPSGHPLELEIPVTKIPENESDATIHQLAARKLLQDLEEGTSFLHGGEGEGYGGRREEYVKREGVRLGVGYGLASRWTSFVAVQKKSSTKDGDGDESMTEAGEEEEYEVINDGYSEPKEVEKQMDPADRSRYASGRGGVVKKVSPVSLPPSLFHSSLTR